MTAEESMDGIKKRKFFVYLQRIHKLKWKKKIKRGSN